MYVFFGVYVIICFFFLIIAEFYFEISISNENVTVLIHHTKRWIETKKGKSIESEWFEKKKNIFCWHLR